MGCATISGIGSRIFCRAAKAMWEGLQRTTDCSSKRFSSDFELVSLGAISLSVLAIGRSSTSASIGGRRAAFSSVFSSCWRVITTTIHDDRRHHRARPPAQRRRTKKNGDQAIGRSRGGLTTKIHVVVDALGNPVEVMLTPGQTHDLACAEPLLEGVDPQAFIGDKAYDADPLRDTLAQREITPVIPPKANRKTPPSCDFALYCERNLIERFFNKLKHFRAIATRYDKLARNFLAGVHLASAIILLN